MKQECWWKAMCVGLGVAGGVAATVTFGVPACVELYKQTKELVTPYVPTEHDVIRKLMSENTVTPDVLPSNAAVFAYNA